MEKTSHYCRRVIIFGGIIMVKLKIEAKDVKGFNFHPSYSRGSLED